MAWYKTGTITVTNASGTVTGSGTAWTTNVQIGDALHTPDGKVYEITALASNTSLTISPVYQGSTLSGQAYRIQPTRGLIQRMIDTVTTWNASQQSYLDGALSGRFGAGSVGSPSLSFLLDQNTGFSNPAADQIAASTGGTRRWLLTTTGMQIDVPITGTAVTQSSTDTTAGRLLKVGDFGQGVTGAPPYVADLNDATLATGDYYTNASTLNLTGLPNHYGTLTVKRWSATIIHQSWVDNAQEKQRRLERAYNSGVGWSDWQLVYNRNTILGPVSQSGGVPTGALIERGSNANGEYVRFADGTQICTTDTGPSVTCTTSDGSLFRSDATNWTFPAAFVSANSYTIYAAPQSSTRWANAYANNAASSSFIHRSAATSSTAVATRLLAIGRWF